MSLFTTALGLLTGTLFAATPAAVDLCAKAEANPDGRIALVETEKDGMKGVLACEYVGGTTAETYAILTDYPSYPRWFNKIEKVDARWETPDRALVTYRLATTFGKISYTLRRTHIRNVSVVWDYAGGDLKNSTGSYRFRPASDPKDSWFMLEYYMGAPRGVPAFVENYMTKKVSRQLLDDIRSEVARRQKKP